MQQPINHEYYYADEAEQFTFYRLPKSLFTNDLYKTISADAKVLYGLMLDRMGLSLKNGWLDKGGKVYIYFTLEDVQEYLNCQRDKGMKLLAELDDIKGVGLIERVRQGLGKPSMIYVKKFKTTDLWRSEKPTSGHQDSPTSGDRQYRPTDYGKTAPNNNELNNNKFNDINPIQSYQAQEAQTDTTMDGWDEDGTIEVVSPSVDPKEVKDKRFEIQSRIDYFSYLEDTHESMEPLDEIVELMLEIHFSTKPIIRIAGNDYPAALVKDRFSKLTEKHIGYVTNSLRANTTRVRNIKKYLLAALFNAPTTADHFYTAEFNYLYKGGGSLT